ncbi:MAG: NUDIX hydrolase [Pseudomonadales bacterium]
MGFVLKKAATVVPITDGENGLEVLLLRRSGSLSFAPGLWVFPGGSLDDADCEGATDETDALATTAVREAQEEAALILEKASLTFFQRYTTPRGKKRFETWFFAAPVDRYQLDICPDGGEIDAYQWVQPAHAISLFDNSELPMYVPTGLVLMSLATFEDSESVIGYLQTRPAVDIVPRAVVDGNGLVSLFPGDTAYEDLSIKKPGVKHRSRIDFATGLWNYEHSADETLYPRLDGGYRRIC